MNNLHLQKFQFLRFTENKPINDIYGEDVWNQDYVFLTFLPREIYAQYLDLGLDNLENIESVSLQNDMGDIFLEGSIFYCKYLIVQNKVYFIVIFNEKSIGLCNTYYFKFTTSKRKIFSNYFKVSDLEKYKTKTTLLSYYHSGDFYNANYEENGFIPQQIRLPFYYSRKFDEVDAENYTDTYQIENKYRSGKVRRTYFEKWKVILNDSNYDALGVALDSDFVFFNGVNYNVKPFERNEDSDEKGFTVSFIDGQQNPKIHFDNSSFAQFFIIKSDDYTYEFEYHSNEESESINHFQVANTFVNFEDFAGVFFNCGLKIKIKSIPNRGYLMLKDKNIIISEGYLVDYCDKDQLTYMPRGLNNNNMDVEGNFLDKFEYTIVDSMGYEGFNIMTSNLKMIDLSYDSECLNPELLITSIVDKSTLKYGWNPETIKEFDTVIFEYALNDTSDFISLLEIPGESLTETEHEFTIPELSNEDIVFFRISLNSVFCGFRQSLINSEQYNEEPTGGVSGVIEISNIVTNNGNTTYNMEVLNGFVGKVKREYISIDAQNRKSYSTVFGDEIVNSDSFVSVSDFAIPAGIYNGQSLFLSAIPLQLSPEDEPDLFHFEMNLEILDEQENPLDPPIYLFCSLFGDF